MEEEEENEKEVALIKAGAAARVHECEMNMHSPSMHSGRAREGDEQRLRTTEIHRPGICHYLLTDCCD